MGAAVGAAAGEADGAAVGDSVGSAVGADVGSAVGEEVGCGVGTAPQLLRDSRPAVQLPARQSWHRWYAVLSWYLPDGQCRQLCWPSEAVNFPAAQSRHELPEEVWNLPTMHIKQAAEPSFAYRPEMQSVQLAALYVAVYLPASHPLQPAVPTSR